MKVVVLPGLDGTGRLVQDFAQELGNDYEVEVVSYPVRLTTYPDISAWLRSRLPHDDYAIVAESFSGPLAIEIGKLNSKAMKALILVATFARSPRKVSPILLNALRLFPYLADFYARASLPFVVGRSTPQGFLASYRSALRELALPTLIGRLQAVLQVDVRNMLAGIEAPTAYIRATKDRLISTEISSDFRQHCALFESIDAPHFVLQTKPREAASIVRDFLAKQ